MPKISVVMPVYNGEKYLREAIDSILNQTFPDFEFIIINDASKDSTEEIIKSYKDERIVYLKNEQNLGVAGTLNRGLDAAKGEYIARMDADDISMPQRFEKQITFMENHPEVGVCGSKVVRLYEDGTEEDGYTVFGEDFIKINMLFAPCVAHPVVMIRGSIIQENQFRYDEFFEKIEDYDLWCRINEKYDIDNVPETLFKYRIHSGQVTQIYANVQYEKLIQLKSRLLDAMNIEYTEKEVRSLVDIGCGELICEFQIAKSILEKIYASNAKLKKYNHKLLGSYLRNILFRIYSSNENFNKQENCLNCEFISNKDIFVFRIKNAIKRYLEFKR